MQNLLLGTIFLTPLIAAIFDFGFEQIKVIFLYLAISILGLVWVIRDWNKLKIEWTNIKKASLLFILSLLLTSIIGVDLNSSFLGKDPYFQGIVFYAYLFLFSMIASTFKIELKKVVFVLSLSCLFVSFFAVIQALQLYVLKIDIPNYAGRVVSTFGQPNLFSGFLVMSIPFIYLGLQTKWKKFYMLCLIFSSAGIVISASRASIALLIGLLIFFFLKKISIRL